MRQGPAYRNVTGSAGRRPWLASIAIAALVGLAALKPWEMPAVDQAAEEASADASVTGLSAVASTAPIAKTADQLARPFCPGSLVWMVHSFQRRGDEIYDVWTVTEPVAADMADPATMAFTPIYASQLMAFGYCAPGDDPLRPEPMDAVTIWRVDDRLALIPMPTVQVSRDLRPDFGALLAPVSAAPYDLGASGWPEGRYLIRVGAAVLGARVDLS